MNDRNRKLTGPRSGKTPAREKVRLLGNLSVLPRQKPQARSLLAAIVESSEDAIISKDLNGIIMSWNKAAERTFGYKAREAIGKSITMIIPDDRLDEETRILGLIRRGEPVEHFETVRVRRDGTMLDIALTVSPVRDERNRVIGASKVARDISERKRAEEREKQIIAEAVAATAKFRAVFEQTTVFAGILTKEGILADANRLSLEACGYGPEEVLGLPFWDTPWWRNIPESRDKIRAATPLAAQGIPYRETLHYSWADGTERVVDFALHPIRDPEGKVLFLHPTGVDITDLKQSEESHRKLVETLDAEVRARTRELEERNTELLRQSDELRHLSWRLMHLQDQERRHIARELHDSTGQLLALLNMNLSTLRKSGSGAKGKKNLFDDCVALAGEITSQIRTMSYLLHPPLLDELGLASALKWLVEGFQERSGIGVTLDIASQFARLPPDLEIVLFRIVQESLSDIHRHSGSKAAFIRVVNEGDSVSMQIRDSGRGISEERLAELRTRSTGVGIGGMRERVLRFDGTFDILSGEKGTQISVTVPAAFLEGTSDIAPSTATSTAPARSRKSKKRHSKASKRILLIDDHELMRRGVRGLLEQEENIEVCGEAATFKDGLRKIQQLKPDLIVLDLNMSDGDGWQLVRKVQKQGLSTKIVIFTAYDTPEIASAVANAACQGFVPKSKASTELVQAIRTVLRQAANLSRERRGKEQSW